MCLSTILGSFGAILLAFLSPLPLFAVALGRGWVTGMAAALMGSIIVFLFANGMAALFFIIMCGLPATLLARQALLARPLNDDPESADIEWFPPGLLAMWLTALPAAGLLTRSASQHAGTTLEAIVRLEVEAIFEVVGPAFEGSLALSPDKLAAVQDLTTAVLPGRRAAMVSDHSCQWSFGAGCARALRRQSEAVARYAGHPSADYGSLPTRHCRFAGRGREWFARLSRSERGTDSMPAILSLGSGADTRPCLGIKWQKLAFVRDLYADVPFPPASCPAIRLAFAGFYRAGRSLGGPEGADHTEFELNVTLVGTGPLSINAGMASALKE